MSLPLSTPNWADSSETGAPSINNVAGSGLAAIIAFAVTGFNIKAVSSITVAAGVATATCASHGYSATYGKLVKVSGAPEAGLNGNHRLSAVTTNTFTYPAAGVPDGTYTGTIEARRAPLGWVVEHVNGANTVAILRRTAVEASAQMLRIDDTGAQDMRVLMVESATDVDTYVNPSPTAAQLAGGQYWHKGGNTAGAKRWAFVGNDRAIYPLLPGSNAASPEVHANAPMFFGDGVKYYVSDAYFTMLNGSRLTLALQGFPTSTVGYWGAMNQGGSPGQGAAVIARNRAATGFSTQYAGAGPSAGGQIGGPGGQTTNTMVVVHRPVWVLDNFTNFEIRGEYPGLAAPLAVNPFAADGAFAVKSDAVGDGRTYLSALVMASSSNSSNVLFDLTGPWYLD